MVTARLVSNGVGIGEHVNVLAQRLTIAGLFLFFIGTGEFSQFVMRSSEALLSQSSGVASVNVVALFDQLVATTLSLYTGELFNLGQEIAALFAFVIGMAIVANIVVAYIEVYVAFSAGVIALAFGALTNTRHFAISYLKRCAGRIFRLFTALLIGALAIRLLQIELDGEGSIFALVGALITLLAIMRKLPSAVEQSIFGKSGITRADDIGAKTAKTPLSLARLLGAPV